MAQVAARASSHAHSELNVKYCELLQEAETNELGSVHALMVEIRQRLEIKRPEVLLVPPSLAITFTSPNKGIETDLGGDMEVWL